MQSPPKKENYALRQEFMYNNAFKNVFPFLNSASKAGSPPGTAKMQ